MLIFLILEKKNPSTLGDLSLSCFFAKVKRVIERTPEWSVRKIIKKLEHRLKSAKRVS